MAAPKRNHMLKDEETVVRRVKPKEPLTVNCVCPKCGSHHRMKLIWSGRGMPKKFCPPCKIFVSSIERVDLCAMPARVDGRVD